MIKTEEILVRGHRNKKNLCDIFLYEPENIEEASLGNLYIVAELALDDKDAFHLVDLLSSLIKREYYAMPHRGPIESLEAGLKKANATLSDLANQGNLEWLGKLHFICAVINKEEDLFLTQTGAAQAFLCRAGQLASISKRLGPVPEKVHPAKTFQNVISGKIAPGDKIVFSTPSLFEIFPSDSFRQVFGLPSIESMSMQIKKTLQDHKKLPPMSTLLMEIAPDDEFRQESREEREFITPPIDLEEILK